MAKIDGISHLTDGVLKHLRAQSQKALYQRDFDAWAADVLGRRYYAKLRELNAKIIEKPEGRTRFAIKSSNGAGKSIWLADWETFWVTVFPPEESLVAATATGRDQIEQVVFKYLKDNWGHMNMQYRKGAADQPPIGWINENLEWQYKKPDGSGNENLVFGKRPADRDIVSSFQGRRKRRTLVGLDEAGGIPTDLFTAAEAIATGSESRQIAIGNPDRRGTKFWNIFNNPQESDEWEKLTISAYDLPTITGEIVYPDDDEAQKKMLAGMTAKHWIYHKERVWKVGGDIIDDPEGSGLKRNLTGKPNAVFMAKVLGEFPGETDNSVFPEEYIKKSQENDLAPEGEIWLGVDVAGMGDDESVAYVNKGGHVRLFTDEIEYKDGQINRMTSGVWTKEDEVSSARRIHAIAMHLGADQVRVDGSGMGSGIYRQLLRLEEFEDKCYDLYGILGASSSPDAHEWERLRDFNHFSLVEKMRDGKIDMDASDNILFDQLMAVTYALNMKGARKVTPKKDMRSEMHGSPDRLDAFIYATTELEWSPDDLQAGDRVEVDIDDQLALAGMEDPFYSQSWW